MTPKPAVYAGSFDPITNGHLDVIRRAARLFGAVRVVILTNPHKKPLFSVQQRLELIRQSVEGISGVTADSYEGLLVDYMQQNALTVLVRGVRGAADAEAEAAYAYANQQLYPGLEVVWLPAANQLRFVSSSAVRESFSYGRELPGYVPAPVCQALRAKFSSSFKAPKDLEKK